MNVNERLRKHLKTDVFASDFSKLVYLKSINSTQSLAKQLLTEQPDKVLDGTVIISDIQTDAYGRFERKWHSPDGGLWFSLILKPSLMIENTNCLVLLISLIVAEEIIRAYRFNAEIKWPNDIIADGRKLAGIIIESSIAQDKKVNWIIIGIGVNVNNDIPDELKQTAISIRQKMTREVDKYHLFAMILNNFENKYTNYLKDGLDKDSLEKYKSCSLVLNKKVRIQNGEDVVEGIVKDINSYGGLVIELQDSNNKVTVYGGEIINYG